MTGTDKKYSYCGEFIGGDVLSDWWEKAKLCKRKTTVNLGLEEWVWFNELGREH